MSPKKKTLGAKDLVLLAKQAGFSLSRQHGSHMIFHHPSGIRLTISDHKARPLHPKIVKKILKDIESAGVSL
jgi:predicted RNA binding protein YcfA (HicA-like mRNA interferase family)